MLSKQQEKLIRSLHTKKGRAKSGFCLVEGEKVLKAAGRAVQFRFSRKDAKSFDSLVTTETPQDIAGVAKIPCFGANDLKKKKTIVVLDGVQDPGNVGAILRLCLGFNASLLLVESADPTSTKVIRASVGALFTVPWVEMKRDSAEAWIKESTIPVFRLETPNCNSSQNAKYQPLSASGGIPNTQSHTMTFDNQSDAPACGTCGSIMVRNASCYKCLNCVGTSGCS